MMVIHVADHMPTGVPHTLQTKGKLSEDEARKYMGQLIDGLSYCHHQGIVHRNLKVELQSF